jgi:S-adenosylmethionine synthetase
MSIPAGIRTSESVTAGHPDKVADRISDAILDHCLAQDPAARVACETLVTRDLVVIAGEVAGDLDIDPAAIARTAIADIGYDRPSEGFAAASVAIDVRLQRQSADIARGVDTGGAGDQGLMVGFACDETPELLPLPIAIAHRLARQLHQVRSSQELPWLRPDGKTQVSVRYADGRPVEVTAVVVSAQHTEDVDQADLHAAIRRAVIDPIVPSGLLAPSARIHINPTGRFVAGGPAADTGLTGRKIIVDTYGGAAPHGGGAFSGKDPSKQDRSGAYAARQIAASIVHAGLARRAQVQLAYAIGVAEPVSVTVETDGTGRIPDRDLSACVLRTWNLTPAGIIRGLDLRQPRYAAISAYGHVGRRDVDLPWERPRALAC